MGDKSTKGKTRTLERMNDFTPLRDIVTLGRRLNDGTHVRANGPFADRKLSWTAATLPRRAWQRAGAGQVGCRALRGLLDKL